MNELLEFFTEYKVPIQITLDIDMKPTVHALFKYNGDKIHKTDGLTVEEALYNMKQEYLKALYKWMC